MTDLMFLHILINWGGVFFDYICALILNYLDMKKILFLLFVFIPMYLFSQNKYFDKDGIKELRNMVSLAKLASSNASLQSISETRDKFINKVDSTKDINDFFKINKDYISELYGKMYSEVGTNDFKFSKTSYMPTILNYNTGKVLILGEIISTSVFNNRVLNVRGRAKNIVQDISNLIFQRISEVANNKTQYIGLCIGYASKDFSEKYESSKGDCIIVVAPVSEIKNFYECKITEDEFCKKCDYYISSQEEFMGIKKINLEIF